MAKLLTEDDIIIGNMYERTLKHQLAPVMEKFSIDIMKIMHNMRALPDTPEHVPQAVLKQHIASKAFEQVIVNMLGHIIGRAFPAPMLRVNACDMIKALAQGIIDASATEQVRFRMKIDGETMLDEGTSTLIKTVCAAYVRTSTQVLTDFVELSDRMKGDDNTNRPRPTNKII